jgi:hypothetical protein
MSDDWRDDPAFLRDEAIRQAALATGAMREADDLRQQLQRAVSPDPELLAFVRDFADWHTTADLNALAPRARDLLDRFGGQ